MTGVASGGTAPEGASSSGDACEVPYSQPPPVPGPLPSAQAAYQVPPGATWDDIAADTGVDVPRLLAANNIDPSVSPRPDPTPGAYIVIPAGVRDACIAPANDNTVDLGVQCNELITSSRITVGGVSFVQWFNKTLRGTHGGIFNDPIKQAGFNATWDNIQALTGKTGVVLSEFVAHLMIMYNETGGTLEPKTEIGTDDYFFETRVITRPDGSKFTKSSYNVSPNRSAGDQLSNGMFASNAAKSKLQPFVFGSPVITTQADVAAWNGPTYPAAAPSNVKLAAQECDFYKFRGRGLNQLTWRGSYKSCAEPSILAAYSKTIDQLTNSELDSAFSDPRVYLSAFHIYCAQRGAAIGSVLQGNFAPYGSAVSGDPAYGQGIFTNRCTTLRSAMMTAGVTVTG